MKFPVLGLSFPYFVASRSTVSNVTGFQFGLDLQLLPDLP